MKGRTMQTVPKTLTENSSNRFDKLAMAHKDFMLNYARKLTGNKTHADDLFQDTYFKAFKSFRAFDGGAQCRAWLKKIMINTYINSYNRKRKILFLSHFDDSIGQVPANPFKIEPGVYELDQDSILRNYVSDEIKQSLMLLPSSYRRAVILYDMLGLTYKEIAVKTKVPIGTIKSRLFRGRAALRGSLNQSFSSYLN